MKDKDKITLTVRQLKRLFNESRIWQRKINPNSKLISYGEIADIINDFDEEELEDLLDNKGAGFFASEIKPYYPNIKDPRHIRNINRAAVNIANLFSTGHSLYWIKSNVGDYSVAPTNDEWGKQDSDIYIND